MAILPQSFVHVPAALTSRGVVNVVGIVVDVLPLFRTSGTSVCVTFTIKDCDLDNGHTWDGLKIKYFNDNENYLPHVMLRDVVLLRNIRIGRPRGQIMGVASQYETVPWAIFRPGLEPSSPMTGPIPFDPSYSEKKYAQSLVDRVSNVTVQGQLPHSSALNPPASQESASKSMYTGQWPFLLVKDIQERTFVSLLGEIVKAPASDFDKAVLYFTDYTANKDLINYSQDASSRDGDEYGYLSHSGKKWPGPVGRMTLQITLWEPHATYAREHLKAKDFVRLNNVHIKRGRIAQNLEANIHSDRRFPDKIHVKPVHDKTDNQVRDLLQRRAQYQKEHPDGEDTGGAADSKKSKKQQQQQQQQQQERKKQQARGGEGQTSNSVLFKRTRPNENIRAIDPDVPCRSLEDILSNESHKNNSPDNIEYTLPFQNLLYRAYARVVDFFPPNLEDFAVPLNGKSAISSSAADSDGDSGDPIRWEWRFCLLLESGAPPPPGQPKKYMKLFVSGHDAEYLLRMDAVDLRRNEDALVELRERLFLLWGNLEELRKKAAAEGHAQLLDSPSSVPFVCCVKEYGVQCSHEQDPDRMQTDELDCGYEGCLGLVRQFAMFGTTIHD